ncbi:hypothetical protein PMIN06_009623 [Paraphaeosphaeria minitans]
MSPKRKRAEPEEYQDDDRTPTYASELLWLNCLTDPSRDFLTSDGIAEKETNTALITAACKLTYILYHNVQAQEFLARILRLLNKSGTEGDAELTRVAKSSQSAWKAHVVNKFLLRHVKETVRKWCVARPYKSFGSLPANDRIRIWLEAYDADPKGTVVAMWKPVIGVLDLDLIFRTDLPAEDDAKMRAVRWMLRHKYFFGCECTYKYSVADTKKIQKWKTLEDWASYAMYSDFASHVVPFTDLPISPTTLAITSSERSAKKTKITLANNALESAFPGSAINPSNGATVASATSDLTLGAFQEPREASNLLSSLSNSRTASVAPSLPAPGKEENTDPKTFLQELISWPSPNFARTKDLPVFQPAPKPNPPPKAPMTDDERHFNAFFGIPDQASLAAPMVSEASSSAPATATAPEPELDEDSL